MKKNITAILYILILCPLIVSCSANFTGKDKIIQLYVSHENLFSEAALTGDFESLEKISGVQKVSIRESDESCEVDIFCGGSGFGSSTHYYGIRYSETFDPCACMNDDPLSEWKAEGNGYRFDEANGDNSFYYEPLGNHYFYYEEHY